MIRPLASVFEAFYETQAEREEAGDPRLSLEERYETHRGFVMAVRQATMQLIDERMLLPADGEIFVRAAQDSDVLRH